ncbi:MAG TPA: VWA domain-containing protein [Acidimicrobiales bacterium]|nr:VWA domain-containing protein [Acidimicrobiales bacterium]
MGDEGLGRFGLLASAIAGRPLEVAPVDAGQAAWTDGATVFIDADSSPADQLRTIAAQASLLGAGSLATDIVSQLPRRAAGIQRYLAVEGHRALAANELLLPPSVRSLIDRSLAARSDSPRASLALANSRAEQIDDPPALFGTIRPREIRAVDEQVVEAAAQHLPRRYREEVLRELDDGEADEHERLVFDFSSPVGGGGVIGRLLKRLLSDTRSSSSERGEPGADEPTHVSRRSRGGGRPVAVSAARATVADDSGTATGRGVTYPEWDVFQRRYRHEWCTVIEVEADSAARPFEVAIGTRALRRPLAHLGTDLERRHRQLQGDDIDVDAAVEARVELLAGSAADETLYIDSVRARRDLSVLVLLDVSGSAGEPSATGVAVHEHQRAAAAALTMALHELGDRVALYAFRSQGRAAVHMLPLKRFDAGLDAMVMRRVGGLTPGAYTRVGAAIRHGAWVLEHDGGTSRRLLVVLSDGFAYDHGYEGSYGEADARRALAEARRRGTGCLCLSIGAGTDPADLRRVFGTAAHATIPRADQLADVVGRLFQSALKSAEVQRTASQRRERTRERLAVERRTA